MNTKDRPFWTIVGIAAIFVVLGLGYVGFQKVRQIKSGIPADAVWEVHEFSGFFRGVSAKFVGDDSPPEYSLRDKDDAQFNCSYQILDSCEPGIYRCLIGKQKDRFGWRTIYKIELIKLINEDGEAPN